MTSPASWSKLRCIASETSAHRHQLARAFRHEAQTARRRRRYHHSQTHPAAAEAASVTAMVSPARATASAWTAAARSAATVRAHPTALPSQNQNQKARTSDQDIKKSGLAVKFLQDDAGDDFFPVKGVLFFIELMVDEHIRCDS